jgi:hypothetical protein
VVDGLRVGVIGEKRIEQVEELPAIPETGQLVGDRLTVAFLGKESQRTHGESQPNTDGHQGRRGKGDGNRRDLVQGVDQ